MVALLAVGFVANLLVRPVADQWQEPADEAAAKAASERSAA
jgi:hypothetical protein